MCIGPYFNGLHGECQGDVHLHNEFGLALCDAHLEMLAVAVAAAAAEDDEADADMPTDASPQS